MTLLFSVEYGEIKYCKSEFLKKYSDVRMRREFYIYRCIGRPRIDSSYVLLGVSGSKDLRDVLEYLGPGWNSLRDVEFDRHITKEKLPYWAWGNEEWVDAALVERDLFAWWFGLWYSGIDELHVTSTEDPLEIYLRQNVTWFRVVKW